MRPARMALAAALGLALATGAAAQGGMGGGMGGGGMGGGRGMWQGIVTKLCPADIEKHCATVPAAGQRDCLAGKINELSEPCLTAVESTAVDRGPGTGPVASLCMTEIAKFCPEVEHVQGQVRRCLTEHKAELAQPCVVALENTGPAWAR
ncbi:hypothetical protein JDN40_05295 [Rhodomicrobium vannielii ATCC 17100]|uniref:hypothetical protein n=1 Tax=Rhodomicrobium vannielii TaxID=1069 RepID=UPI001919DB62|nr:hypothetical protein [Rhodomicrobium vannielii]MBJ7533519.1 hypothetical protein [Rhodomicrobium vannielii ATCC 17100]